MPDSVLQAEPGAFGLSVVRPAPGSPNISPPEKNYAWWALIAVSVAADFLMLPAVWAFSGGPGPPSPPQAILGASLFGSTLAQGSLLAAWLVWSDARFSRRLLWHWIIAGCLCSSWLAGLALAAPPKNFREVGFTVALTVPVVSLGAQLPLWIVRLLFGWRLVRMSSIADGKESFSIRDLLLATLLVAASFGVARLSPAAQQDAEFRVVWFVYMTVAALFSVFAILPTAPLLLRPRRFSRAVQWGLAYAAAPITLLWLGVAIVRYFGLVNLPAWTICLGASCLVLCYALTAILAAAAARSHGYCLAWGRECSRTRSAES